MVEGVEIIDGIKIFEFSSEIKLLRYSFVDEFARKGASVFAGFEKNDLYSSNLISNEFNSWYNAQLFSDMTAEPVKKRSKFVVKRPAKGSAELKNSIPDLNIITIDLDSSDSEVEMIAEEVPKACSGFPIVETIVLDDDDTSLSSTSGEWSGEPDRLAQAPIIEIDDSESESKDSAISMSVSMSPTLLKCPDFERKPSESNYSEPNVDRPFAGLSNAILPARARVITVEVDPKRDKLCKNISEINYSSNILKQWCVQKKTSPLPKEIPKMELSERSPDDYKNRENIDNTSVAPVQKPICPYYLACLSPGVGYIPLLEFGINLIKFEDPFGSGDIKCYSDVLHATKWLNLEVQSRFKFDSDCPELKWTVVNAVIVKAKRLHRLNVEVLCQSNCRITKNGVVLS